MDAIYGELNPVPENKVEYGFKGKREHIVLPNTPNSAHPGQTFHVVIPRGSSDSTMVRETQSVTFELNIESKVKSASIVQNIGRNIIVKKILKLGSKELEVLDNCDIFDSFKDLDLSKIERKDRLLQGIQENQGLQSRLGSTKKVDGTTDLDFTGGEKAISTTLGSRFKIPLDFEFFKQPVCPYGLHEDLIVMLELSSADKVLLITNDNDAKYDISDIAYETDVIIDTDYAWQVCVQYERMSIPFTKITNVSYLSLSKKELIWPLDIKVSANSIQGLLLLFKEKNTDFSHKTEKFYNPTINKVSIAVDGSTHQFFRGGMLPRDMYPEIRKYFKGSGICWEDFLTTKFALWIDMRSTVSNTIHGTGRRVGCDIKLQISKVAEKSGGTLLCYIYAMQDMVLHIKKGIIENIEG